MPWHAAVRTPVVSIREGRFTSIDLVLDGRNVDRSGARGLSLSATAVFKAKWDCSRKHRRVGPDVSRTACESSVTGSNATKAASVARILESLETNIMR